MVKTQRRDQDITYGIVHHNGDNSFSVVQSDVRPKQVRLLVWSGRPGSRSGRLGVNGNHIAPISKKTVIGDIGLYLLMKMFLGAFGKGIEELQVLL